ncbi:hypothetical protein A2U01_0044498, partial [Trifolium medium]|nr:hypothetical protein [Trifolium medium]
MREIVRSHDLEHELNNHNPNALVTDGEIKSCTTVRKQILQFSFPVVHSNVVVIRDIKIV